MQSIFDKLYSDSKKGRKFKDLLSIITDENNIIGFENETYIAINNNNPSNIIIIGSYDLDLLKQITPTIKNK